MDKALDPEADELRGIYLFSVLDEQFRTRDARLHNKFSDFGCLGQWKISPLRRG